LKGGYVYNGGYYQVKSLCDSSGSVTSMLQLIFAPESILMFCGNVCLILFDETHTNYEGELCKK
jgi:hypothetical protein